MGQIKNIKLHIVTDIKERDDFSTGFNARVIRGGKQFLRGEKNH